MCSFFLAPSLFPLATALVASVDRTGRRGEGCRVPDPLAPSLLERTGPEGTRGSKKEAHGRGLRSSAGGDESSPGPLQPGPGLGTGPQAVPAPVSGTAGSSRPGASSLVFFARSGRRGARSFCHGPEPSPDCFSGSNGRLHTPSLSDLASSANSMSSKGPLAFASKTS